MIITLKKTFRLFQYIFGKLSIPKWLWMARSLDENDSETKIKKQSEQNVL